MKTIAQDLIQLLQTYGYLTVLLVVMLESMGRRCQEKQY